MEAADKSRPVLVAEDNPDDVRLLEFAWRAAQVKSRLQQVADGDEVVAYLTGKLPFNDRRRFQLPCLLLLDLKMPRKDGFEVLETVRALPGSRRLPVIVLTSSVHKSDMERAYDLGASAFLVKPVELQNLVEMVKAINAFWLTYNRVLPFGS